MIPENEIVTLSTYLPFWTNLSEEEKDTLIRNTEISQFKKNSHIHMAELECAGVVLVKKGTLRIYMLSENGKEITLYRISSGEVCILSASCVLQSITFDVSIDAVTDCELIQISSAAFSQIMNENIYIEAFAYKKITERFSDVMWAMEQILFMSFDQRLAAFLLDESSSQHSDTIKMTHEDIAKMLGSAREVVSRMLKYFSEENLVKLSRGSITILSRSRLLALL